MTGTNRPLLAIRNLTKRYGEVCAVEDLSLEVEQGEFLTLLGPSGCGKSTTLMSVAGFETPDSGTIVLAGRDITNHPPESREMGVVFQNYALFPHMTVFENVMFPLRMRQVPGREAQQRVRDALDLVELDLDNALPGEVSGGQAQRVALARALVFRPRVLLMDEPLAALDRRLRQSMQFELRRIESTIGATVIYVTHDQEEALALSDRIAVMRSGRLEQVGTPSDVYRRPASVFVADFIGESNRLPVNLTSGANGKIIVSSDHPDVRFVVTEEGQSTEGHRFLVVRPESVVVIRGGPPPSMDFDCCDAVVKDVTFLGDHVRIQTSVFDKYSWTVKSPATTSAAVDLPDCGEVVLLAWRRDAARLVSQSTG